MASPSLNHPQTDRESPMKSAWRRWRNNKSQQPTVPLPDYNGQDVCGITVHFLPCDDVKVTTSCWSPRNVNYPIKEPVRMKEPAVCPK
ncbi:hypothetical protein CK506_14535 [Klebsiella pneumoniae]|nr:hypothetical protein CK506_14535 [Klebsiella pneumoniae]